MKRTYDKVEEVDGALIQHGHLNNRIYLMDINDAAPEKLIEQLNKLATKEHYTKIFAKVPSSCAEYFLKADYRKEASVPRFYGREGSAVFLSRYLDKSRGICSNAHALNELLDFAISKGKKKPDSVFQMGTVRRCTEEDSKTMASLYNSVFLTYPFPIFDSEYLRKTMKSHIIYFGIEVSEKLVALASADINDKYGNVEFTDFATMSRWRGKGFAAHLLRVMEAEVKKLKITTAYTITRAASPGINSIFAGNGYTYSGTLMNNTNIYGRIESMNVWYKHL